MITLDQYAGIHKDSADWNQERQENALELLSRVNSLIADMQSNGVEFKINPITKSMIGGETFGGFRPQSCPIGAPLSAHKTGQAVDIFDPLNTLDSWIDKNPELLVRYNLYREAPVSTNHWLHLSSRAPHSGNRTFQP